MPSDAVSPAERARGGHLQSCEFVRAARRGAVIARYKSRLKHSAVDSAIRLAAAKHWLRFDGRTYSLTQEGVELGIKSSSRPKVRRVMPF